MSVEILVDAALPERTTQYTTLAFSREGDTLLAGTNRLADPPELLGVQWLDWTVTPPGIDMCELPDPGFQTSIDAGTFAIDVGGGEAILIADSMASVLQAWRVDRRAAVPPRLLRSFARDTFQMAATLGGAQLLIRHPQWLELIRLDSFSPELFVPLPPSGADVHAVAVSPDRTGFAIAHLDRVICLGARGQELASWPVNVRLHRLVFAERELLLWGVARDQVLRFEAGRAPRSFALPKNARLSGVRDHKAIWLSDEVCELDLDTGAVRSLGRFAHPAIHVAFDVARRRLATLGHEQGAFRLRVARY
jgi:hypothetical protein